MRNPLLCAAFAALFLVACGADAPGASAAGATASLETLPATVDGVFEAHGGSAETNGDLFYIGTLTAGGDEIFVKVPQAVARSAGMKVGEEDLPSSDGAVVRATITSKADFLGEPLYSVSTITRP